MKASRKARSEFYGDIDGYESLFVRAAGVARSEPGVLGRLETMPVDEAVRWAVTQLVAPS